ALGLAAGAIIFGLAVQRILFVLAKRAASGEKGAFYRLFTAYEEKPTRLLAPLLALLTVVPWMPLAPELVGRIDHAVGLAVIASIAWVAIAMLDVFQDYISHRHAFEVSDNLAARRIRTQVQVLRHIGVFVIIVIAVAIMVMTFPNVRHVGE